MSNEAIGYVVLLVATALLLAGARAIVVGCGIRQALDVAVAVPIIAATQIVVTLLVAGALGQLDAPRVLALNGVVTAAALGASRSRREHLFRRRGGLGSALRSCRRSALATVLVAFAVAALIWRLVIGIALPPYGYDAVSYHLPAVIEWLHAGKLVTSPLNTCCAYYPADGELLVAWPALLSRSSELVDTVQIASALVAAIAVGGIARVASVPPAGAWMAAAIFLLTPIVLAQTTVAYVDVTFAAAMLAAAYLLMRCLETSGRERWALLAAGGAAAGLCLGTKPNGALAVIVLVLPFVIWAVRRRPVPWRTLGLGAALFGLPVVTLGAFWYLRSWIVTGNPFYPARIEILGVHVFDGIQVLTAPPKDLSSYPWLLRPFVSWSRDLHFWTNQAYSHGQQTGGLGPAWSYLGAVCLVPFGITMWRRRRVVFAHFLVPITLFFLLQPYSWWSRFSLPLAGAGAVALAWALTSIRGSRFRLALGLAAVVLVAGGGWLASARVAPGIPGHRERLGAQEIVGAIRTGHRSFGALFDSDYVWVNQLRHPARIAIDTETIHMTTAFAGRRFQHVLLALPRRGDLEGFVRDNRIDYVVARRSKYYDRLLSQNPGEFEPIDSTRRARAYRVRP